jgi:hypothetical protein
MRADNVEIVRRLLETNRSDALEGAVETGIALTDPSMEFRSVLAAVEPRTYRGHDGVREYFRDMAEAWREWRLEVVEASTWIQIPC